MKTNPWVSLVLLVILYQSTLRAQTGTSTLDTKYIPADAIAIVSVWPRTVAAQEAFKLYPFEVATAAGMENVGIDPLKIERIDAVIGLPGPAGPVIAAMITMASPIDVTKLKPSIFADGDWQDEKGFRFRRLQGEPEMVLHLLDRTHAIVGTKPYVRRMAQGTAQPDTLSSIVSKFKSQQAALAVISVKSLRPMLEGFAEGSQNQLPKPVADDLQVLASNVDHLAVRTSIGSGTKTQILIAAPDAAAGGKIEACLIRLMNVGSAMLQSEAQKSIRGTTATEQASRAYIVRLGKELVRLLTPRRTNERLLIELENNTSVATTGVLVGLLLPAVQAAREAARRMQSSNNLKQIGLALHNYHDAFRKFPPSAIRSSDGKPLLSWRVAILPYIEQKQLYEQFHRNESWDSEHNIKLIGRMPATYRHPNSAAPPGQTIYLAVVGDEVGLKKNGETGMKDIFDGTSNTVVAVEVHDEFAKPWTAPNDFEPTQDDPIGGLRIGKGSTAVNVLLFDGSIQMFSPNIDRKMLWSLFTRAGGEVIQLPR